MGFFSAIKRVGKLAAKVTTAPVRLQARVAGRILTAAGRVGQSSGGARPATYATPASYAAPSAYARGSYAPASSPASYAPASSAPSYAPASSAPSYAPASSAASYAPASSAPSYAPGDPYALPGGGGGGGGGGGRGAPPPSDDDFDGGGYGVDDGSGDEDDAGLGDVDYLEHFGDLAGWKDSLLNLAKGAGGGLLTTGAGLLTAPSASQIAAAAARAKAAADAQKAAGMPTWVKVAIGGAVALPVLYLVSRHKGGGAQVAPNPRRKTPRRLASGRFAKARDRC
jgi:hypothetical protein